LNAMLLSLAKHVPVRYSKLGRTNVLTATVTHLELFKVPSTTPTPMMAACTKNGKVVLPFFSDGEPVSDWQRAPQGAATLTPSGASAIAAVAVAVAATMPSVASAPAPPSLVTTTPAAKPVAQAPDAQLISKQPAANHNVPAGSTDEGAVSRWGKRNPTLGKSADYHRYDNVTAKPRLRGQVEKLRM
jgi:hypothetical protein